MIWDHYDYKIAGAFLPALINADESGMTEEESTQLAAFEAKARADAEAAGFTVGHWSTDPDDEGESWGTCDVCDCMAMRYALQLMVYRKEVTQ